MEFRSSKAQVAAKLKASLFKFSFVEVLILGKNRS